MTSVLKIRNTPKCYFYFILVRFSNVTYSENVKKKCYYNSESSIFMNYLQHKDNFVSRKIQNNVKNNSNTTIINIQNY